MFDERKINEWSSSYWNHIQRNIGLITINEQEKLRTAKIVIIGIGGLGGPLVEQLVRCGCENIVICDIDKFEESNLNRQLCIRRDLGKFKVDVIEERLKAINIDVNIDKFYKVNKKNISLILDKSSIVALTLDDPLALILITRECIKRKIPMIESYAIPFIFAWWFTYESIDYEDFYNFSTKHMSYEEIERTHGIDERLRKEILSKLLKFPKIGNIYNREKGALNGMIKGELPLVTLAPIVWITASYLAFEIIYAGVLNAKKKNLAPNLIAFDYFWMKEFKLDSL